MSRRPRQTLEELGRCYAWDNDLIRLLECLPRAVADQYIEQAWSYDKEGWRHVLAPLPATASVLCLDARFGNTAAAFAQTGATVTVIHPSSVIVDIIRHRLASANSSNVEVIHVPQEAAKLPFPDGRFDAFIHHDVVAALLADEITATSPFASPTPILVDEVFRVLKTGGFAYFGVKNPYGYIRLLKRLRRPWSNSGTSRLTSIPRAGNRLRRAGFQSLRVHPYLVESDRVSEVIAPSGYRSTKNSWAASERFKRILLGKTGARLVAPAYALVCAKGRTLASPLQDFIDDLSSRRILSRDSGKTPGFQSYLSLPGKVIVTLGIVAGGKENVVIVIPKTARVLTWRRKEVGIVNEIRALSPFLASRLPRLYTECSSNGETYFAISEIPGITIDRRVRHLERLTRNAVDFLIQFNRITAREIIVDDAVFTELFGVIVRQVMTTYPETRHIMKRIEDHLRGIVHDRNIVTVWLHGDYKLENLIFDKAILEINGIIDWEQSRRNGLPWLDLMYLLAYNRIMIGNRNFFDVYRETIQSESFTEHEKSIIAAYERAVPVTPDMKAILTCLFFLHHIGFRYIYSMRREHDRRNILTALDDIEQRLAQLSA